jgi:hypothetical protein
VQCVWQEGMASERGMRQAKPSQARGKRCKARTVGLWQTELRATLTYEITEISTFFFDSMPAMVTQRLLCWVVSPFLHVRSVGRSTVMRWNIREHFQEITVASPLNFSNFVYMYDSKRIPGLQPLPIGPYSFLGKRVVD